MRYIGFLALVLVASDQAIRMIHVSGTLTFSRERSTRLDVGLIKVQPGEEATEDAFLCDHCPVDPRMPMPALEIGTLDYPLPAHLTATIRLTHFAETDKESLPGILVCRGRWDIHGARLSRTWVKLGATAKFGKDRVVLAESVTGWKVGDRILVTASNNVRRLHHYRGTLRGSQGLLETEERAICPQRRSSPRRQRERLPLKDGVLVVRGTTTENGTTRRVVVNGVAATSTNEFGSWEVKLTGLKPGPVMIVAAGTDAAGNVEQQSHQVRVVVE